MECLFGMANQYAPPGEEFYLPFLVFNRFRYNKVHFLANHLLSFLSGHSFCHSAGGRVHI